MQADRDLIIVPGVRADRSEPLERAGVITKLGLDATRRNADRADWTRAQPPAGADTQGTRIAWLKLIIGIDDQYLTTGSSLRRQLCGIETAQST